jgi:hypothetical protein
MKILKIVATLLLVGGIALSALAAYGLLYNEDLANANRYAAEQSKLLAEAFSAKGTPRERALMKEYEDGKGVTELARTHARRTTQSAMLGAGGGLALIVVSVVMLIVSRKRTRAPSA